MNLMRRRAGLSGIVLAAALLAYRPLPVDDARSAEAHARSGRPANSATRGRSDPDLLALFRNGPMRGVERVVFAVRRLGPDGHWYANFGYYADGEQRVTYASGARLCLLELPTGKVTVLFSDERGGIRDPVVHYDAGKILFSYRRGGQPYYHLYEINVDGTGLRQLTSGPYDDIEPTYLPNGDIVFVSSRCKRWVNCWLTKVAVLYRCSADGRNVRPISANNEHDNTPWVLPDGRLIYQRWEYVDRSQVDYHHLWTCNPDGTNQMVFFGNMHPSTLMIDAKPVPNSPKVVSIFSPGHGRREHMGAIVLIDPFTGPDDLSAVRYIQREAEYRDPWAFSEHAFLAARGAELVLLDDAGHVQSIYTLPREDVAAGLQCHEPRPLVVRPREQIIADRVDLRKTTGRLVLADIYKGRNMVGVKRGEIKKLLK